MLLTLKTHHAHKCSVTDYKRITCDVLRTTYHTMRLSIYSIVDTRYSGHSFSNDTPWKGKLRVYTVWLITAHSYHMLC